MDELKNLNLIKQHSNGYLKHNSKDILLSNNITFNDYLIELNQKIKSYNDRITELEQGGGGGTGGTGGKGFSFDFKTKYDNTQEKKYFFQDSSKDYGMLILLKTNPYNRLGYYNEYNETLETNASLFNTYMGNSNTLKLTLTSIIGVNPYNRLGYYNEYNENLEPNVSLFNTYMGNSNTLKLTLTS